MADKMDGGSALLPSVIKKTAHTAISFVIKEFLDTI